MQRSSMFIQVGCDHVIFKKKVEKSVPKPVPPPPVKERVEKEKQKRSRTTQNPQVQQAQTHKEAKQ